MTKYRCPHCGNRQPYVYTQVAACVQLYDGTTQAARAVDFDEIEENRLDFNFNPQWQALLRIQPDDFMACGDPACSFSAIAEEFRVKDR